MKEECTNLFSKYRDMARSVWNIGFWPNDELRATDCFTVGDYVAAYDEAMARLYEGLVLFPLGHFERVRDTNYPGRTVPIYVEVRQGDITCLVDSDLPGDPCHRWEPKPMQLHPGGYEFEFMAFFDWDQLGHRDFLFVEVLIREMDALPGRVGHHALLPVSECQWFHPAERSLDVSDKGM